MTVLQEDKRASLLTNARYADDYAASNQSLGKNRMERRVHSKVASTVRQYNQIDMNQLFKDNILDVSVEVNGETDTYLVKIKMGGFLDNLREELEKQGTSEINLRIVTRALVSTFNTDDVYVHCSCLHPDTKIKLLDGTTPTVVELMERYQGGEKLYVYSVDKNGDFKPGEVEKVWQTSIATKFVKITLDNGEEIITTPEHLYLNRLGEYVQAGQLKIGDSLMPLYFSQTRKGYDTVKLNSSGKYHSVYKLVANHLKSEEIFDAEKRARPEDSMLYSVAVHHRDFNKHNNTPENLQIMTAREHWDYHASLSGKERPISERQREISRQNAIKRNANPTPKMLEARKKFSEAGVRRNYEPDRKEQQAHIMKDTMTKYYASINEEDRVKLSELRSRKTKEAWNRGCFDTESFEAAAKKRAIEIHSPEREKLIRQGIKDYWDNVSEEERERRAAISRKNIAKAVVKIKGEPFTEEHKEKIRQARLNETPEQKAEHSKKIVFAKIKKTLMSLIENGLELTEENYNAYRGNGTAKITTYFTDIDEAVSYFQLNHKVVGVEYLVEGDTPVYDIKVKEYHNFLVDAGVILHNCPDWQYRMAFWATRGQINSGEPENRPSDITNPDDSKGPGCKHVLLCLSNNTWLLKVASVITNYIKYMEKHQKNLYTKIIYPAIYGSSYQEPDIQDETEVDELGTDKDTIDVANKYARIKNLKQYQDKEPQRVQSNEISDQG